MLLKNFFKTLFFLASFVFIINFNLVYSQNNTISLTVAVEGGPFSEPNGSIVVLDKGVYKISSVSADPNQVGVITLNPSVTLRKSINENVYDVNTSGNSFVKATNKDGKISKGDYVTASDIPGVATKSNQSEFIIGVALEDFDSESGLLRITVEPRYVLINASGSNLLNIVRQSSQSVFLAPIDSLRYILAAVVVIASLLFGFSIFGKITGSGIQALARNPLARSSIQINIIIEFILNIAIIVFGIVIAYFILTL